MSGLKDFHRLLLESVEEENEKNRNENLNSIFKLN